MAGYPAKKFFFHSGFFDLSGGEQHIVMQIGIDLGATKIEYVLLNDKVMKL